MTPFLFLDSDDDSYAAEEMGIPRNRLCRDAFNVDAWVCEPREELRLADALVITDSDYPDAVDHAEMAAAHLSDLFARARVLALRGGLTGWIARGADAGSL